MSGLITLTNSQTLTTMQFYYDIGTRFFIMELRNVEYQSTLAVVYRF